MSGRILISALVAAVILLCWAPRYALAQTPYSGTGNPQFDSSVFGEAMRATQHPGTKGKSPAQALSEAKKKIYDVDPRVRVAALDLLEGVNTPEANALLMRGMTDRDLRVKIKAIDILGAHADHDAVGPMSRELFLRDTPAVVKLHLVAALGSIGDESGALPVMQYLQEVKDERSQGTAVFALGEMGNPQAIGPLTQILSTDKSPVVRRLAQEALAKINGELPSVHSEQVAAERDKQQEPTYERLSKLREMDEKLQQQNW
ncbi:MAG: HEAT repeat domain-containing protein [Candidatus Binataceae bacterium]